jgi:hypothetical protein
VISQDEWVEVNAEAVCPFHAGIREKGNIAPLILNLGSK